MSQTKGVPLEAGKEWEIASPLEPPEWNAALLTRDCSAVGPMSDSHPAELEGMRFVVS